MRVCLFGTYSAEEGYPMNRVLEAALVAAGAEVVHCHVPLWRDAADKLAAVAGLWAALTRGLRLAAAWVTLTRRFRALPNVDYVVVGYPGHLDVRLARWLVWWRAGKAGSGRSVPVILNGLTSLTETLVTDRRLVPDAGLRACGLSALDRWAWRAADLTLVDTDTHGHALAACMGNAVERERASGQTREWAWVRVWVGADPHGLPEAPPPLPPAPPFQVLYAGTYIPLHGVPHVLSAARQMASRNDVEFRMVGRGAGLAAAWRMGCDLPRVTWLPRWLPRAEYLEQIATAHVVLGAFDTGPKAQQVIPCKVFDGLAMGRVVVTADTPAARELLRHGESAWLVPPGEPDALADGLAELAMDLDRCEQLARNGHQVWAKRCSPRGIGVNLLAHMGRILGAGGARNG